MEVGCLTRWKSKEGNGDAISRKRVHKFNLARQVLQKYARIYLYLDIYMKLLRRFKPIIGEGQVDLARFLPRRPLGFHRFFRR